MKTIKLILVLGLIAFAVQNVNSACSFTWTPQSSGSTNIIYGLSAVDENICWIAGTGGTIMRTTNAGVNWISVNNPFFQINDDVYNIWAVDANTAYVSTFDFTATVIFRTTDAGGSWTFHFFQPGGFINSIIMKDANTGFAYGDPVGSRWSLWKTTNSGLSWDSTGLYLHQAGSEIGWNNSMSIVGDTIWFGTNNSRIYRSTNYGATGSWTACLTVKNVSTYGVSFINANTGLCVGTVVGKTTNGGVTWFKKVQPGGSGNIMAVSGKGRFFWVCRNSVIYGSTNRGKNWNGTGFTATNTLLALNIAPITGCPAGWCSGNSGTVIKLTGIGSSKPEDLSDEEDLDIDENGQIPDNYELSQNYPNPFNPATNIKFSIPKIGLVKLVVYDILGNEIKTLVNENLSAGNYKADFDASRLASGVYFYKLITDGFTQTRKMLLVK